jgi:hypothetical protein
MKTRVKICGVTTAEDARGIAATGADYLGLVFTDSPRRVPVPNLVADDGPEQARGVAPQTSPSRFTNLGALARVCVGGPSPVAVHADRAGGKEYVCG